MNVGHHRKYFLIFFTIFFIDCNNSKNTNEKIVAKDQSKYAVVKDWPQLPNGFSLSAVTGIGVDTDQNVFIFQRTGRKWEDHFPDSLISSNTIFLLDGKTGKILKSWGANLFIMPHGLSVDKENNIWVTDVGLSQVFKFDHDGKLLLKLGVAKIPGDDPIHFNEPTDVAVSNDGSFYVSDGYGNSRIIKFSKEGKYILQWGKKGNESGELNIPHAIGVDSYGNVYVADRENNRIQKFDPNGNFLTQWKNTAAIQLFSLSIDKANHVIAADNLYINDSLRMGDDIIELDSALNLVKRFGREDKSISPDDLYHDIAVDKEGNIYVADDASNRIRKFQKVDTR